MNIAIGVIGLLILCCFCGMSSSSLMGLWNGLSKFSSKATEPASASSGLLPDNRVVFNIAPPRPACELEDMAPEFLDGFPTDKRVAFQLRNNEKDTCYQAGVNSGQPCDPLNPNQRYVYDSSTNQIVMAENSDECLDDGGDANEIRPWKCGAANVNQKWVYHTENAYIRNPNKQMCLDDNNGDPNKFHLWPCNSQNVNQKFHPVVLPFSKQVLETDPKRMIPNVQLPADKSTKFMIQNASKGLCLDTSTNKPEACDWGGNQMFTYNSNSNQIVAGNGECLDDGGSVNKIHTWPCDANNRNQLWTFDSLTKVFRSLSKNACLDDNDGGQFHLWSCDGTNPNQQYEPSILY